MKQIKLAIYGAPIGDYYGSYWEFLSSKPIDFEDALTIRRDKHSFTDDTFMTMAIAKALLMEGDLRENVIEKMIEVAKEHPSSYGCSFSAWVSSQNHQPYDSWGNGSCMRVSPAPLSAKTMEEAVDKAIKVTEVTHNHEYSIRCVKLLAKAIFIAKEEENPTKAKELIWGMLRKDDNEMFKKIKGMDLKSLYKTYYFTEEVMETFPQAMYCALSSKSFIDCLQRSILIGGDSDTLAAISCSLAAPLYGDNQVLNFIGTINKLPLDLHETAKLFSDAYLC